MIPSRDLIADMLNAIASTEDVLLQADDQFKFTLIENDFDVDPFPALEDLVLTEEPGLTPISPPPVDAWVQGTEPETDRFLIQPPSSMAALSWPASGIVAFPKTFFGLALTDTTGAELKAVHKFEEPLVIESAYDVIDVDTPRFTIAGDAFFRPGEL